MLESILIATLIAIAIAYNLRSKQRPSENPVVIQRMGSHHIYIAPKLSPIQSFIERVVQQYRSTQKTGENNLATQYFWIKDNSLKSQGVDHYLMAITVSDNITYIQAILPENVELAGIDELRQLQERSSEILQSLKVLPLFEGSHPNALIESISSVLSRDSNISATHFAMYRDTSGNAYYTPIPLSLPRNSETHREWATSPHLE